MTLRLVTLPWGQILPFSPTTLRDQKWQELGPGEQGDHFSFGTCLGIFRFRRSWAGWAMSARAECILQVAIMFQPGRLPPGWLGTRWYRPSSSYRARGNHVNLSKLPNAYHREQDVCSPAPGIFSRTSSDGQEVFQLGYFIEGIFSWSTNAVTWCPGLLALFVGTGAWFLYCPAPPPPPPPAWLEHFLTRHTDGGWGYLCPSYL